MKPRFLHLFAYVLVLCFAPYSQAGEIYEFYNGVRALGMGGAYVTTANDETAMYTNPAGLGKLRDVFITMADPEASFTQNITDFVPFGDILDVASAKGLVAIMQDQPGEHLHFHAQIGPRLVIPNFGFGILAKWESNVSADDPVSNITINYRNDYVATMAYNFRLFDGILKIGFNGKFIDRIEVRDRVIPASTTDLTFESIASEGTGISTDVGIIATAPVRLLPALGIVVRDAGNTKFDLTDGAIHKTSTRPLEEKQKIDAGLSISPIFGKNVRATIAAEVHNVMTEDEEEAQDIMRRFHAGMELNVADFFFIRGGWHQKYYTAGFEFASARFQLQGATYGEDIGTPNNPREDRRVVGKFSLRF